MVELLILLVRAVGGLLQPQGRGLVDLLGLRNLDDLFGLRRAVLVLLIPDRHVLFHGLRVGVLQHYRISHVAAVAVQDLPDLPHVQEFLFLLRDMQDNVRAVGLALAAGKLEAHAVLRYPVNRLRLALAAEGLDFHLVTDHEDGIEAQAEVADDIALLLRLLVLKLLHELRRAGESHLVDVLADFICGHADTGIGNPDLFLFLIHGDSHAHGFLTVRMEHPELGDSVTGVGNRLPQENILVRIQPAFDHRHYILRVNRYGTFFFLHCHKTLAPLSESPAVLCRASILLTHVF